jgi:hypothetical protein
MCIPEIIHTPSAREMSAVQGAKVGNLGNASRHPKGGSVTPNFLCGSDEVWMFLE